MTFSDDKEKYAALGGSRPEWPVFMQAWWLDAACSGRDGWSCVLMLDADGRAVGAMPFFLKKNWGVSQVRLPPLTPWLGIWAAQTEGAKPSTQLSFEKEVFSKLLSKLPVSTYFLVNFHWSLTNWLPFHWAGFRQTARVTYTLDSSKGPDFLWENFQKNARTNIKKAARELALSETGSLEEVYSLLEKKLSAKSATPPFSLSTLKNVDAALVERGQRRIFFARDAENRLHAAAYLLWNGATADVLFTASDPELRQSGAIYFLFFEIIKFLFENDGLPKLLDFEGSMLEEVEIVYRSFGAEQRVYPQFFRAKNRFWDALYLLFKR